MDGFAHGVALRTVIDAMICGLKILNLPEGSRIGTGVLAPSYYRMSFDRWDMSLLGDIDKNTAASANGNG